MSQNVAEQSVDISDETGGRVAAYQMRQAAAESEAGLAILPRPSQAVEKSPRKAWLDYLRVFAILAVITGHVIADFYARFGEVGPAEWWLSNVLGFLARSSVPVFVMVSGAVLLGKPYTLDGFYRKRAARLIPPIVFWNLVYLGVYVLEGMDTRTLLWTLKALVIVNGHVAPHLWYLSMFACLMVFVPFVNKFILGEKPTARELAILLGLTFPFFLLNMVASVADNIYDLGMEWFKIFPWFMVYFIAGYYIDNHLPKIRLSNGLLAGAIVLLVAVGAGLNYYAVSSLGIMKNYFINTERGPLLFLISILVFLLAKNLSARLTPNKFILAVAEASFGMYLIHEIFNGIFANVLPDYYSRGLVYIPLVPALTAVLSFVSIYLLRKIRLMRAVC